MLPRVTNFNSIKVQLEPEFGLYKSQIDDFNSIKVQLEHKIVLKTTSVLEFQFHKGTIRTHWLWFSFSTLCYFNSIKVQLELTRFFAAIIGLVISIP